MHISEFSVRNPILVNLVTISIIVVGAILTLTLPLELFPSIKLEMVTVTTVYPGASAEDVEQLITIPLEEEISTVSGIDAVHSVSSEGRSFIVVEVETGEDSRAVAQDVDSVISRAKEKLPEDAEEPIVEEVRSNFPLINVVIAGTAPKEMLRKYAFQLRDKLKTTAGIDSVTTSGLGDPAFWIYLNPAKLKQNNISVAMVADAIKKRNIDFPAGSIEQGKFDYLVRTKGKIRTIKDLENIPVATWSNSRHVLLRDIARIELGEEKTRTRARANGLPAITFLISKKKDVDAIKTVERIKSILEEFKKNIPPTIDVTYTNDNSTWIKKRFKTMTKSGVIGLVMVLICLGAFLDLRASAIAAIGIPISFLGALILMKLSGITLNLLSMFGLILVLGILVDDAIIVVENIQRYLTRGMSPLEAAIKGTKEVAIPVTATVMTNIAAFIPLLFSTGMVGEFLSIIPTVAIYALIVSLVEALFILPSHCADYLKESKNRLPSKTWILRLRRKYLGGLIFALRNRYAVVGSFVLILALSLFIIVKLPLVFFYIRDTIEFMVRIENPPQSSLEYTEESAKKIEKIVNQTVPKKVLKNILILSGLDITTGKAPAFGDNLASMIVEYEGFDKRKENGKKLMNEVRKKAEATVAGPAKMDFVINAGPPTGKPVDLRIQGSDLHVLKDISFQAQRFLQKLPGVYGVSDDLTEGKPEIKIYVDEEKAALYGLRTEEVAAEIRSLIDGLTVDTTRVGKEETEINIRYEPSNQDILSLLKTHQIMTPKFGWVNIGTVSKIEYSSGIRDIRRYKYRRAVSVTAEVDQNVTTSLEVNKKLKEFMDNLVKNYNSYTYQLVGEQEEFQKTLGDIFRASIVAIMLIYTILATVLKSYSQPLIIMSILPFTFIGVITGVLIRGEPLTFPAIIGTVALFGIVVNDSLVLVDFINNRRTKMDKIMAVVFSAKYRFRPIILTTLTTFGGLFSLMYHTRGEAAFLAPMAVALGVGLVFATFVTLYLIPCLYLILEDLKNKYK